MFHSWRIVIDHFQRVFVKSGLSNLLYTKNDSNQPHKRYRVCIKLFDKQAKNKKCIYILIYNIINSYNITKVLLIFQYLYHLSFKIYILKTHNNLNLNNRNIKYELMIEAFCNIKHSPNKKTFEEIRDFKENSN